MKYHWAYASLACLGTFATVVLAQPVAPESPATPLKAASPYRLSPSIQTGSTYAPASEGTVYVDPEGDDANHGETEAKPVRSLASAFGRLATRHAMLLKRGGTYSGSLPKWTYSNKLIGAYGNGRRPVVKTEGRPFLNKFGSESLANVTIRDIVFDNEGQTGPLFAWLGAGRNILIENCDFLSGGLVIQTHPGRGKSTPDELKNWKLVGNKVVGAWNIAGRAHASGLYASGVDGLDILRNTFDHNGWNPAKQGGQATMFNHNLYLSHVSNVTVKDNDIVRASSMGIKFRSDATDGSRNIVVEGNRFLEGELGIHIGGNTNVPGRFRHVRIVGNTFDRLGASQPTGRKFAWGIDVVDNVDTVVKDNLFTNMPAFSNQHLVKVSGTQERVVVENNVSRP